MPWVTVAKLEKADVQRAFPLMQLQRKDLTLTQWASYAHGIIDQNENDEGGFLVARDRLGVILGVLQYQAFGTRQDARRLTVSNLIAHGHFQKQRRRIALALIQALDDTAHRLGCRQVRIELPEGDQRALFGGLTSLLCNSGPRSPHISFKTTPDEVRRLRDGSS
jgi:GNAT superfamily N-acetyltransferase